MSFATELVKRHTRGATCLEIVLDNQTLYLADTSLQESDKHWEPRILNKPIIKRAVDPENLRFSISEVNIELKNDTDDPTEEGYFETLLGQETFKNREANIYLKYVEDDGTIVSQKIYSGVCEPKGFSPDGLKFSLIIRNNLQAKMRILQRVVNTVAFPNAPEGNVAGYPESTVGWGLPVVAGETTSNRGSVRAVMIDDTADAEKFVASQGGIFAVNKVVRKRADAYTTLTEGGGNDYTVVKYAKDEEGNAYAYIQLTAGKWAEGDELYVDLEAPPYQGYATLNGTDDILKITAANSPSLPGRAGVTGSFTLEFEIRPTNVGTLRILTGIIDPAAHTEYSWQSAILDTGKVRFYLGNSAGTATAYDATAGTTALANNNIYVVRVAMDMDSGHASIQIGANGAAFVNQALTEVGAAPSALFVSASDYELGSSQGGVLPLGGRLYKMIIAAGHQPSTVSGASSERDDPLEDIISEWRLFYPYTDDGTDYQEDLVGENDLELVNLAAGDYTLVSQETNPAWLADRWLRWSWYWHLASADIDRASLATAAAFCTTNGYDDAGDFGFISPKSPGTSRDNERDQWALFTEFCRSFGHNPIITSEGRVALKRINITEFASGSVPEYRERHGHMAAPGTGETLDRIPLVTEFGVPWKHTHHGSTSTSFHGYDGESRVQDLTSQSTFGVVKDAVRRYRAIRNEDMLKHVVGRDLLLASGKTRLVTFTTPYMLGLQTGSDLGDSIKVSAVTRPGFDQREMVVIEQIVDPVGNRVTLKCLTIGDHLGPVSWRIGGGQEEGGGEDALIASASAFVGRNDHDCGANKFTDADNSGNYSTQDYLRHGHHYVSQGPSLCTDAEVKAFANTAEYNAWFAANIGIPACKWWSVGYGNINWRLLLRYDLNGWSGRTLSSVSIRLHILQAPNFLQGYNTHQIHILIEDPIDGFDISGVKETAQTYRSGWSGGGVYAYAGDAWVEGTVTYANSNWAAGAKYGGLASGAGTKLVVLNAAGIAAFQAAADVDGTIDLVLQSHNDGNYTSAAKIASTRHADEAKQPAAAIVWT